MATNFALDLPFYRSLLRGGLNQRRTITGQETSPETMEALVQGELGERYLAGQRSRQLGLQERQVNISEAAQKAQEEQFGLSQALSREQLAQQAGQFGVTSGFEATRLGLTREEMEAQKKAAEVAGYVNVAQLGLTGAGVYAYGAKSGIWGGGAGASAATVPQGLVVKNALTGVSTTTSGLSTTGTLGWAGLGYAGGTLGAKYGPGRNVDVGGAATLGQGGQKEKSVTGGAIKGAGVGATGFLTGNPVIGIVTTIAGAIGGAMSAYKED